MPQGLTAPSVPTANFNRLGEALQAVEVDSVPQRGRVPAVGPTILLLMGVSGAGKTTIARELAARLGWALTEGDALHPAANVAKMHEGISLTDADREPWLDAVGVWIDGQRAQRQSGIVTCSALKRSYRQVIVDHRPEVRLVYLRATRALVLKRLVERHGHFMPPSLLQSQFDILEEPSGEENPIVIDIGPPSSQIAEQIIGRLGGSR